MADIPEPKHLDERLFKRFEFILPWFAVFFAVLLLVSWPIRNFALVCWVCGSQAFFHDGVRVLAGKPTRFSTGVLAPTVPDIVTGIGAFFITFLCLKILTIVALRFYERHFTPRDDHAA
jgi:hypothetical protein